MESLSFLTRFSTLLLAFALIGRTKGIDITFDTIECDESLPAYALTEDVRMTCNDGQSTRCSFGQEVTIRGTLQYYGLNRYTYNGTGYASADLRLMSVEYNLFEEFPIDFCGSWVEPYNNTDALSCPYLDGSYYFGVAYTLPFDDDDLTTWFATGWSGASSLQVRNGYTDESTLLADCTLHWRTSVTPSQEDGWATMPSAAQAGIILASVLTAILCCCTYITCCRRRKKHVTDVGYYGDFADYADYEVYEQKQARRSIQSKEDFDNVEASRLR